MNLVLGKRVNIEVLVYPWIRNINFSLKRFFFLLNSRNINTDIPFTFCSHRKNEKRDEENFCERLKFNLWSLRTKKSNNERAKMMKIRTHGLNYSNFKKNQNRKILLPMNFLSDTNCSISQCQSIVESSAFAFRNLLEPTGPLMMTIPKHWLLNW